MNGIIRVASYARVSSQKQADEQTIESQCEAIRSRIEQDGLTVAPELEFCDQGYSGSILDRPKLEVLRDRVAASLIDRIYVHSPDRLARKYAHQALLLEEFARHDCEVVFGDHQGLAQSPETNLLVQMQGVIAEYEREKILERTRRGRRFAAKSGRLSVFGRAPYGYQYIKAKGPGQSASWEIDPVESAHIRLMFDLVGNHEYSLGAVCRELQRRGILTKKGNTIWHNASVHDMLRNTAYHGEARYGKQRSVPRKAGKRAKRGDPPLPRLSKVTEDTDRSEQIVISVPRIVERSLFDRVQEQLNENQRRQRERQQGAAYMLSGLTICGVCGSAYCVRRIRKSDYLSYRCIGSDRYRNPNREPCTNRSVNGHALEAYVWKDLCELLTDPSRVAEELSRRSSDDSVGGSLATAIREVESAIEELQGRIERIIDAYESGHVEKSEFERRIVPLRARQDREREALLGLRRDQFDESSREAAEAAFARLSSAITSQLADASAGLQRSLCKLLINRIEIGHDSIRLVYKVPISPFDRGPASRGHLQHYLESALMPPASVSRSNSSDRFRRTQPSPVCLKSRPFVMPPPGRGRA
jgi:site-specific DNA recombinase